MMNFMVIGIILVPLYFVILFFNIKKKKTFFEHLIFTTFYIYLSLVIKETLFQIPINREFINILHSIGGGGYRVNLIPFKSIYGFYSGGNQNIFLVQVGGNILMFVPLGAYIPLIIKKFGSFSRTVILAILASFMIETTQGIISLIIQYGYRSVDIDDIILNTIGASIGYMFFKFAISPVLLKNPWLMNKEASFSTFDPL